MAVNKQIKLTWQGKEYKTLMTMRLIEAIEDGGLNLAKVVNACQAGDLKFSVASRLISAILNDAGANTSSEEVFDGMFSDEGISPAEVINLVTLILSTIFPAPKKKPVKPPTDQKKKATKRKAKSV